MWPIPETSWCCSTALFKNRCYQEAQPGLWRFHSSQWIWRGFNQGFEEIEQCANNEWPKYEKEFDCYHHRHDDSSSYSGYHSY
jgi:hypothetical protein